MRKPLVLYSAATWLAYTVAERYYQRRHYLWCSPCFAPDSPWANGAVVPPTSCPSLIYHSLWEEVRAGDRHSAKIKANREGIIKGAEAMRDAGVVTAGQEMDIRKIVDEVGIQAFRPLMFVIPYGRVAKLAKEVDVSRRAHPLAIEFTIEGLSRDRFDVIELRRTDYV